METKPLLSLQIYWAVYHAPFSAFSIGLHWQKNMISYTGIRTWLAWLGLGWGQIFMLGSRLLHFVEQKKKTHKHTVLFILNGEIYFGCNRFLKMNITMRKWKVQYKFRCCPWKTNLYPCYALFKKKMGHLNIPMAIRDLTVQQSASETSWPLNNIAGCG